MLFFTQPMPPSAKAHLESQFALWSDMSKQLFTTVQKINELNIQVAQTVMEESITSTRQVMEAQTPYEALSIAAGQVQPAAEKMRAYQQHLTNIAATTQVDLAKTAETHVPETSRTASAVADEVARRASEETQKATQRQKEAIDKLTTPINKPAAAKTTTSNVH
jgi:phasin family protein